MAWMILIFHGKCPICTLSRTLFVLYSYRLRSLFIVQGGCPLSLFRSFPFGALEYYIPAVSPSHPKHLAQKKSKTSLEVENAAQTKPYSSHTRYPHLHPFLPEVTASLTLPLRLLIPLPPAPPPSFSAASAFEDVLTLLLRLKGFILCAPPLGLSDVLFSLPAAEARRLGS